MPLPFLTADRTFDGAKTRTMLPWPFDDHDLWRRPYHPGPGGWGSAAVLLLLASFVLIAGMITAFAGALGGAAVCMGAAGGGVIAAALRSAAHGGVGEPARGLRRVAFVLTTHGGMGPGSRRSGRRSSPCGGWGCPYGPGPGAPSRTGRGSSGFSFCC